MPAFDKVLIANRGEIACRIIRACRALGMGKRRRVLGSGCGRAARGAGGRADRHRAAGAARQLSERRALLLGRGQEDRREGRAPGAMGFSPRARTLRRPSWARGLVWIGPEPGTIADMGHKSRARELAEAAGVPVVPGSGALDPADAAAMAAAAARVGYPAAGQGGPRAAAASAW